MVSRNQSQMFISMHETVELPPQRVFQAQSYHLGKEYNTKQTDLLILLNTRSSHSWIFTLTVFYVGKVEHFACSLF